jgi:predicted nucleic acid-binding Zn finger protein
MTVKTIPANDPKTARAVRAMLGMVNRQIKVSPFIAGRIWVVESSMSGSLREYMVCRGDEWSCTCPDFQKRGHQTPCKHILAARLLVEQRV